MKPEYVIYLSDKYDLDDHFNNYGYWTGKDYVFNYELFPVTDYSITGRTKRYSSKKRADNALKAALNRPYAYVCNGKVVEVKNE